MASGAPSFLGSYLPYLLRQADQTLSAPFYAALARRGIPLSEWRVLAVLHEFGALCVADLAAAALSPQPTVTHASRRLEARGFVEGTRGADDKRQRIVSITPDGSRFAAGLIAEAERLEAELLADAGDLTDLADRLRALTEHVSQRGADNARL